VSSEFLPKEVIHKWCRPNFAIFAPKPHNLFTLLSRCTCMVFFLVFIFCISSCLKTKCNYLEKCHFRHKYYRISLVFVLNFWYFEEVYVILDCFSVNLFIFSCFEKWCHIGVNPLLSQPLPPQTLPPTSHFCHAQTNPPSPMWHHL